MRILILILLLFSEAKAQIINASPVYRPFGVVSSFTPLLDTYTSAAWAHSVIKLRSAHGDSCIRVRRTSDDTHQVIGFDASGLLDTVALKSFIGSSTGRIARAYDHTGNGIDAVQNDTASQPFIVIDGAVQYAEGLPTFRQTPPDGWGGTINFMYFIITSTGNATSTFFEAARFFSGTTLIEIPYVGDYLFYPQYASGSAMSGGVGSPSYYVNGTIVSGTTRNDAFDALDISKQLNLLSVVSLNTSSWTNYYTENTDATFVSGPSRISLMVMYYNDKSSDRVAIQNIINSYFTIY